MTKGHCAEFVIPVWQNRHAPLPLPPPTYVCPEMQKTLSLTVTVSKATARAESTPSPCPSPSLPTLSTAPLPTRPLAPLQQSTRVKF